MPGGRLHNRREGDRSEYLAVYFLSRLGLVTQVPRQEDIGFDLICNIADQETGFLTFNHHYVVTVKSASTPQVILEPPESKTEDAAYTAHFDWLFRLELALMLAVVDKVNHRLSLYSTLPAWFLHYRSRAECGAIELCPRIDGNGGNVDVGLPRDAGVDPTTGGRHRFEVDLGHPILVVGIDDLEDRDLLRAKKQSLRHAIELGTDSARLAKMGTPFFWWFNATIPGGYIFGRTNPDGYNGGMAWFIGGFPHAGHLAQNLRGLAPGLMAAALCFKGNRLQEQLAAIKPALLLLPPESVPPTVRQALPEIYA
jgi:hypothetical protein